MTRLTTLALAALTLSAVSGCDALVNAAVDGQAAVKLADEPQATQEGDCASCLKFKARPPSGINAPPAMP